MEWVETVAATLEEARELALDQLGVAEDEAEFEIVEEPRSGLFGRTRGQARVRARVRPTQPRPKVDRRGRRVRTGGATGEDSGRATVISHVEDTSGERVKQGRSRARGRVNSSVTATDEGSTQTSTQPLGSDDTEASHGAVERKVEEPRMTSASADAPVPIEKVADEAIRFVDGLLSAFGVEGQVSHHIEGDEIDVQVDGQELGLLVGPRGSTLVAVQELTRLASQRRLGDHDSRLRVDIAGYRERRRVALAAFATKMADEVVTSGTARVLEPMSSPDRKVVHDTLAVRDDVETRSEGDDPFRRVVISPAE
jgi:spoIIIJ-associated protein